MPHRSIRLLRRGRGRGYLLVVVAAVLFAANAGVSRAVQNAGVSSVTLTTIRCTVTAAVLLVLVLVRGERLQWPNSGREILRMIAFGVTGIALVQWFYFVAIDRLPLGVALLLEFTAPVLVALWVSLFGRETVRRRLWLGLGLALGGLALVGQVWSGLALDGWGVLAGFGAAASLATYFLLGERSVTTAKPLHVMTEAFVVAAVFWNLVQPGTVLFEESDVGRPRSLGGNLAGIHLPLWLLLVVLVLLGTVVPFLAELSALQYLSATEVGLIGMLEPVGATVVGWTWFNQTLSAAQGVGVAAILLGIGLAQTARTARRSSGTAVTST